MAIKKIPYIDYSLARRYTHSAEERQYLDQHADKVANYPVTMSFIHNDREVRFKAILNRDAASIWLDAPIEEFNRFPVYEKEE